MPNISKRNFKKILRPTLSLFLICVVITGALAIVNALTAGNIAENLALEAGAARQEIFPGAHFDDRGDYFAAYGPNSNPLGYCIAAEAKGYGGPIQVTVGLDLAGRVLKVRIISAENETPGLGQKIKDAAFLNQFRGKAGALALGSGIDSIASATYSSQGVVDAVNATLMIFKEQIGGESDES